MKGWIYFLVFTLLASSFMVTGWATAQWETDDDDDDGPFGGLFDPENMTAELALDWTSLEKAEFRMSMEMDLGAMGGMFRMMLDADNDDKISEEEIELMGNPFEGSDEENGPLGLEILMDNKTPQVETESGWSGLVGDVDSTEPIGMYFTMTYTWTLDDTLDRHTIVLRPSDINESEDDDITDDINWTDDDDDEGMPFDMEFVIKLPKGWIVDEDSIVPESMKQFLKDDGTIVLTSDDIEAIGEPEGDIVSLEIIKGDSSDSPFPFWIPVGALFVALLSVGLLGRRRR